MYDLKRLKGAIVANGYTQADVSKMLGMSFPSFNKRLNGKTEFKLSEIRALKKILNIECVDDIFFTEKVP